MNGLDSDRERKLALSWVLRTWAARHRPAIHQRGCGADCQPLLPSLPKPTFPLIRTTKRRTVHPGTSNSVRLIDNPSLDALHSDKAAKSREVAKRQIGDWEKLHLERRLG